MGSFLYAEKWTRRTYQNPGCGSSSARPCRLRVRRCAGREVRRGAGNRWLTDREVGEAGERERSLHLAVVGRLEEHRFDFLDQHAVLVAFLVDLVPFGVFAEVFPGFLGGFTAGEGDQVDELAALAILFVESESRSRSTRRRAS